MHIDRMIFGMLSGFAVFLICYFLFLRKRTKSKTKLIYTALIFTYVGALIFLTMLFAPPWSWNISTDGTWWSISRINLRPVVSSMEIYENCARMGDFKAFYVLIGGNLAMLMPLGILASLINPRFRLLGISFLAIAVAFSIEALQFVNNVLLGGPLRTVEIDDFILNVAGCIAAYIVFALIRAIYRRFFKKSARR